MCMDTRNCGLCVGIGWTKNIGNAYMRDIYGLILNVIQMNWCNTNGLILHNGASIVVKACVYAITATVAITAMAIAAAISKQHAEARKKNDYRY